MSTNRLENLQTLRLANVDWGFANGFATLVTGTFLAGFITYIGGSDFWINLVSALPSLFGLLQIPGGILGRRFATFKRFVFPGMMLWRVFYIPLIFLPFLPLDNHTKLYILVGCVAVASAAWLAVTPVLNDWLAELVPTTSRGFFFSRRNAIATAAAGVVGLLGALVLDYFRAQDLEGYGFSALFGLACLCGLVGLFAFLRMHDTPRPNPVRQSLGQGVRALGVPLKNKNFRRVIVFLGVFVLAQAFAGNLFAAFAIKSLHLPYTLIQWTAVMHALGNVLSARLWGFLADKYGNKPILMLVGFGLTLTPVMWLFCYPDQLVRNALILLPSHILVGATWAGVGLCQFNLILSTADPEDRANYLSLALTVTAITGFVSPLLGAQMLGYLMPVMSMADAYKGVFLACMALRFVSVFFLAPVAEEGALRIRRALRDLSQVTPRGVRAMRKLSRSTDVASRAQALASVGQHGLDIAGDEVVRALHDPSPRVRREAAEALSHLRDPNAVDALIHQLVEHPDLVEEETVVALGHLGGPEAVPALIDTLQSPRSIMRRAAAKALGRVGHPSAVPPLMQAASDSQDPDLRRASLQALRALKAEEATPVIADALLDPLPSVRIAAAEAVSELGLTAAGPQLRESLERYRDEASAETAYALGAVGDLRDIPAILREAQQCVSIITRRRCLLGVARLLGAERRVYRLLLLEGMSRDAALLDMLKLQMRKSKRLREALAYYSGGQEEEAIRRLVPNKRRPEINVFADFPVDELFIVAVCTLRQYLPKP